MAIVWLWAWNWRLLLATVLGMATMRGIYELQQWDWSESWQQGQRFLRSPQRPFTVAVGGGGLAAVITYLAASLWANSQNRGLALAAVLQGLGTLLTLGLLAWQMILWRSHQNDRHQEHWLRDLSNPNPLPRLIAVRQLTRSLPTIKQSDRQQLREYFNLMLTQETAPQVREALLDALQVLQRFGRPEKLPQSLQIPLNLTSNRVHHRV